MRDINRIYMITTRLAKVWRELPDWRLAQLLSNFYSAIGQDCFYMEDDQFMSCIEDYIAQVTQKKI